MRTFAPSPCSKTAPARGVSSKTPVAPATARGARIVTRVAELNKTGDDAMATLKAMAEKVQKQSVNRPQKVSHLSSCLGMMA